MAYIDYYQILGVDKNASQDDIKKAYEFVVDTYIQAYKYVIPPKISEIYEEVVEKFPSDEMEDVFRSIINTANEYLESHDVFEPKI